MNNSPVPSINISVLDEGGYMRPVWYIAFSRSIEGAQDTADGAAGSADSAQTTANGAAASAATAQAAADAAQADVDALEPIEYVVAVLDAATPNARVLTGDTGLTVDFSTANVAQLLLDVIAALGYTPLDQTDAPVLVAALGAPDAGMRKFVSDALVPVALAVVVGGGAVNVPVYGDGVDWRVG